MFKWPISLYLNIRQKVMVGLTVCLLAMVAIGGISYYYLHQIELKQRVVEIADDLSNITLEIRRYEKNFLLYGSVDDLRENQRYIQLGQDVLLKIDPEAKGLKIGPQLNLLNNELLAYKTTIEKIPPHAGRTPGSNRAVEELEEKLREHGKNLVELSQQLVTFERQRILEIITTLKAQLFVTLMVFCLLGGFLSVIVSYKIIRPLRVIEKTTRRIARGKFIPIPVLDTRDETQRVIEAFNMMVAELGKRQDQLVQGKKMSSLGVLTAGVAHQLNNPLNNISTSCQIVLEEFGQGDPEFLKKMLTNIEQEVNRARDIVKGLLDFSRVRDFALKQESLAEVVQRSIRLVSSQVPPGIHVVHQVPEELQVYIDAQRMQEVFLNLLMNSIQAIKEIPGEIKIAAEVDDANRQAVIRIEDTGIGISREEIDKVFDPFFTTKEVGVGTGLGLSIVYGVIQQHQGTITVESQEGRGTRFIIRLPLHPEEDQERAI
jgi:two-component system, NtrC family, sensor kinase